MAVNIDTASELQRSKFNKFINAYLLEENNSPEILFSFDKYGNF